MAEKRQNVNNFKSLDAPTESERQIDANEVFSTDHVYLSMSEKFVQPVTDQRSKIIFPHDEFESWKNAMEEWGNKVSIKLANMETRITDTRKITGMALQDEQANVQAKNRKNKEIDHLQSSKVHSHCKTMNTDHTDIFQEHARDFGNEDHTIVHPTIAHLDENRNFAPVPADLQLQSCSDLSNLPINAPTETIYDTTADVKDEVMVNSNKDDNALLFDSPDFPPLPVLTSDLFAGRNDIDESGMENCDENEKRLMELTNDSVQADGNIDENSQISNGPVPSTENTTSLAFQPMVGYITHMHNEILQFRSNLLRSLQILNSPGSICTWEGLFSHQQIKSSNKPSSPCQQQLHMPSLQPLIPTSGSNLQNVQPLPAPEEAAAAVVWHLTLSSLHHLVLCERCSAAQELLAHRTFLTLVHLTGQPFPLCCHLLQTHIQQQVDKYARTCPGFLYAPLMLNIINSAVIAQLNQLLNPSTINAKGPGGRTALHLAVLARMWPLVPLLLHYGASLTACDDAGAVPLKLVHWDLGVPLEIFILLIPAPLINMTDSDGLSVLHMVLRHRRVDLATVILDRGADIDLQNRAGETALHEALNHEDCIVSADLLARLISPNNINKQDHNGETALHLAAKLPDTHCLIPALLEHGASVNVYNLKHQSPLLCLLEAECFELAKVRMLVSAQNINVADIDEGTPLHCAVFSEHWPVVDELLNLGADPHPPQKFFSSPLFDALGKFNVPLAIIQRLLTRGNVNVLDPVMNETPLQRAFILERWDLLAVLLEFGADPKQLSRHSEIRNPASLVDRCTQVIREELLSSNKMSETYLAQLELPWELVAQLKLYNEAERFISLGLSMEFEGRILFVAEINASI